MDDILISYGGSVKALGSGKIGGYLVTYGDPTTPDRSALRDFFTPETDYAVEAWPAKSLTYYHHGRDPQFGKRRLPAGEMKADAIGIFIETQLKLRDEWEEAVYALAEKGKLSWSSGTAAHLVEREAIRDGEKVRAHRILAWPLGLDASLTPTPAEPRCLAVALKSLEGPAFAALVADLKGARTGSLAENTEWWLERGEDLLAQYRRLGQAEVKAGRAMSAARLERLRQAYTVIGEIMAECTLPAPVENEAPGMGAALEGEFLATVARLNGVDVAAPTVGV